MCMIMQGKIIVVEDEMAINDLIAMNLEVTGYEVVSCLDGLEAEETLKQRRRCGGTGALYTSASFSGQSDFASQKSCVCAVAHITKSACPPAAKKRLLPHSAAPQSMPPPLFRVSRKQRYNTLDFAKQNRVPTGMLAPLLETLRQRDVPFAIPHFPRRCIYKLQKCSLQCLLRKCKRKPVRVHGTDFLLDGIAGERGCSFFCIPAVRRRGDGR